MTLNDWLSGTHWHSKATEKKMWEEMIFYAMLESKTPKPLPTPINIISTTFSKKERDVDNCGVPVKYFLDALVRLGYIPDDGPKYVKSSTTVWRKAEKEEKVVFLVLPGASFVDEVIDKN